MCQLLGMSANVPTDICFSFTGFRQRGGTTDHHADGWGIGFFEAKGCRLFVDTQASVNSPIAQLVSSYPIRSKNVISHIRKATVGKIELQNTHPFMREMGGQYWLFAHNGDLKPFPNNKGQFTPVGDTDSEQAFCYLLNRLQQVGCSRALSDDELFTEVAAVAKELSQLGTFNFLLSNGQMLLAHCSTKLAWIIRQAPFATAKLSDDDLTVDFNEHTTSTDRVAVIATEPLTCNESWQIVPSQTLLMFRDGSLSASVSTQW